MTAAGRDGRLRRSIVPEHLIKLVMSICRFTDESYARVRARSRGQRVLCGDTLRNMPRVQPHIYVKTLPLI